MSVSDGYIPGYPDIGCAAATDFLGYQSHCVTTRGEGERILITKDCCPFPCCIDDLKSYDRYLLKREKTIETAYKLHDNGKTPCIIASELNVAQSTIQRWLTHRYTIERRLQELSDMAKYVSWPRDNARV